MTTEELYTEFRWAGKTGFRCSMCNYDSFSRVRMAAHVQSHLPEIRAREKASKARRDGPRQLETPVEELATGGLMPVGVVVEVEQPAALVLPVEDDQPEADENEQPEDEQPADPEGLVV